MFEDAMMESGGRIRTRSRYYTIAGALLNGCLVAGLILVPLLHPEALPTSTMTEMLVAPPPAAAPLPAERMAPAQPAHTAPMLSEFTAPARIPKQIAMGRDSSQPPSAGADMQGIGEGAGGPSGMADLLGGGAPPVVVQAPLPRQVTVSTGVMAGYVLSRQEPVYPVIARQAHIQGTVILAATISKTGTIENLTVVSGPALLAQAAIDAVRTWRYRPFLLNGQPVAVQTQVNVSFTLGG